MMSNRIDCCLSTVAQVKCLQNIGDMLFIPKVSSQGVTTGVNKLVVSRMGSKNGYLRLKINDVFGKAIEQFKYEVQLGDLVETGDQATHKGNIEVELPRDKTKKIRGATTLTFSVS